MRFLRVEWYYDEPVAVFEPDKPIVFAGRWWHRCPGIERWDKRSLQIRIDNLRNLGKPVLEEIKGIKAIDEMPVSMENKQ